MFALASAKRFFPGGYGTAFGALAVSLAAFFISSSRFIPWP